MNNIFFFSILLHFTGDYLLQNDWMATNKTKSSLACFIHALLYSLPFLLICFSYFWLIIFVTHYFIDRYRLAVYWIKLVNWNWDSENFGYDNNKPTFMSIWLMIIIDNVFHILFNTLAIYLTYA
jgi:hypothetical protein